MRFVSRFRVVSSTPPPHLPIKAFHLPTLLPHGLTTTTISLSFVLRSLIKRHFFRMAALSRALAQRFSRLLRPAPPPSAAAAVAAGANAPGVLRRFLQKRPIFQPALPPDHIPFLPSGDQLSDRIKSLNTTRIRLDCLPPPPHKPEPEPDDDDKEMRITVDDARKLLRASQMEAARAKLRAVPSTCVTYAEFTRLCNESAGGPVAGSKVARSLDESGSVIVLGDSVFLRPELVIRAVQSILPEPAQSQTNLNRSELKSMESQKSEIDSLASYQVKRELWLGLGFLVLQTAGFMRLTFWELSWDVMEPICFYVTSVYFMAGYTFFMRTNREPSFEGFFNSRFEKRQQKLMRKRNFDLGRFEELKKGFGELPGMKAPTVGACIYNSHL